MADMICPRCGEPWDTVHIRNDMDLPLPWPTPEDPEEVERLIREAWPTTRVLPEIVEAAVALGLAETTYVLTRGLPEDHPKVVEASDAMTKARDDLGKIVYNTGLSGGCPACWEDPSRIPTDPDARQENLRAAIFDGVWDGDPAEFFS